MQELYQWLALPVEYQPVFTTLIMGSVMGGLTWALRDVPLRVWWWIRGQFVSYAEYTEILSAGKMVFSARGATLSSWLAKNAMAWSVRGFRVPDSTEASSELQVTGNRPLFFFFRGRFFWANTYTEKLDQGISYTFRISTWGRSNKKQLFTDFLVAIDAIKPAPPGAVKVHNTVSRGHYTIISNGYIKPRALESVFVGGDAKERLVELIETFAKNKEWRLKHSRPDKRCVMLEGPPGTGKSSLALALASEFDMELIVCNLESAASDILDKIRELNRSNRPKLVLWEDIDYCNAFWSREYAQSQNGGETPGRQRYGAIYPSELLNFMDGVIGLENIILVLSTNRPEILDPAFTRPCRIDLRVHIPKFDAKCGLDFTVHHYPELRGKVKLEDFVGKEYSGADLTWLLDRYQSDAESFLRGVRNGERPEVVGGAYEGMFTDKAEAA